MGSIKINAAGAAQCLVEDHEMFLDGTCVPDTESYEAGLEMAQKVRDALEDVRTLGAAIEEGDPQTIADAWLRLKPQVEVRTEPGESPASPMTP